MRGARAERRRAPALRPACSAGEQMIFFGGLTGEEIFDYVVRNDLCTHPSDQKR